MAKYPYINVDQFNPNSQVNWTPIGKIDSVVQDRFHFHLKMSNGLEVVYAVQSEWSFRIWFSPVPGTQYPQDGSCTTVTGCIAMVPFQVLRNDADMLVVDQGKIRVEINLQHYALSVYRGNQLVHADDPVFNLVYIPGEQVIANMKRFPANAHTFGFGEKAGTSLNKRGESMTFFNYDNFGYFSSDQFGNSMVPPGTPNDPTNAASPLYQSSPFMMEVNPFPVGDYAGATYSYGIFLDNWSQTFMNYGRGSNMENRYYFGALYGEMDYYFFFGDRPPNIIDQITRLTGRTLLKPKYALGFHQGCYGYNTRAKLETVAQAYRDHDIPCDGLHIDVDVQNHYRTFTTSDVHFPNIAEMFSNLRNDGFKCSTNITPLVSMKQDDPAPYPTLETGLAQNAFIFDTRDYGLPVPGLFVGNVNYGVDPYSGESLGGYGHYADFGRESVRKWWGQQYAYLLNAGLEMIWQDMTVPSVAPSVSGDAQWKSMPMDLMVANSRVPEGTPGGYEVFSKLRNIYSFNLVRATYEEGLQVLRPGKRNFIISRGGFLGVHRFAGLWTGDSASTWDFLKANIPIVLNMGLTGQSLSGSDVGGFTTGSGSYGTAYPDGSSNRFDGHLVPDSQGYGAQTKVELFVRWMTQGAFLPWYRNHYNGYQKVYQEPYNYPDPVPTICRKYIELRYRLIQLFYDAMFENTQTGMPICRALFLNEQDPGVFTDLLRSQFFVGKDLMVAPIVEEHGDEHSFEYRELSTPQREIYLPAGSQWYDFNDGAFDLGAPFSGGQTLPNYVAPLDKVPLFVREGAIIPFRELEQWIGQLPVNPLTLRIYPGKASTYQLYLDDNGETSQAETQGAYRIVTISNDGNGGVTLNRIHDQFTPAETHFTLLYLGRAEPGSVTRDGNPLLRVADEGDLVNNDNAWFWDSARQVVNVRLADNAGVIPVLVQ